MIHKGVSSAKIIPKKRRKFYIFTNYSHLWKQLKGLSFCKSVVQYRRVWFCRYTVINESIIRGFYVQVMGKNI